MTYRRRKNVHRLVKRSSPVTLCMEDNLKIMYTNIDTLTKSKMNLLNIRITQTFPDIICIVELLPKNYSIEPSIESHQLKGYNL